MTDLYREQFDPQNDFPIREKVDKYYVILFTARCGSHLLGHRLHQTGKMGFPLEYFNPMNFKQWQKRFKTRGFEDTYRMIKRFRTSPNGCFGAKFRFDFYETFRKKCKYDEVFPQAKHICIRREDILGQAVSLAKAKMTGKFISFQEPESDYTYDYEMIKKALVSIVINNARIKYFIAKTGLDCCEVTYEELVNAPARVINKIAKYLDVDLESSLDLSYKSLPKKQGDERNMQFKERFIRESKEGGKDKDLEQIWYLLPTSGRAYCRAAAKSFRERLMRVIGLGK